jgi:hypothetical protein
MKRTAVDLSQHGLQAALLIGLELRPCARQNQNGVVVCEPPLPHGLEDVVDHTVMISRHRPNVDANGPTWASIYIGFLFEVIDQRSLQAGPWRQEDQCMEMKTAVAQDNRRRRSIPFVDRKIKRAHQERQLLGCHSPRFPVNPGQQRVVDPENLVRHPVDDRPLRTGKLREENRHQVASPPVTNPVGDHLGISIHLPVNIDLMFVIDAPLDEAGCLKVGIGPVGIMDFGCS